VRTGPVNDRRQCTWRDECERRQEANVPFHFAFAHLWDALRREAPEQPLSPQHAKKFVTAKLRQVIAKLPKGALE
jgi:hypothetical protein